jgi:hypothetical protein
MRKVLPMLLIGVLMACDLKQPTTPSTHRDTPNSTATIPQTPLPSTTSTSTTIPLQNHDSDIPGAIEIVVAFWDGMPSQVEIPTLHIWKDGYAVWVKYSTDQVWHIYETYLSTSEIAQIQTTITLSHFWQYDGPIVQVPDAIGLTIWISEAGKERNLSFSRNGNKALSKFEELITSLNSILDASPTKSEYFPQQGYLFASRTDSYLNKSVKTWRGDHLGLNLETFENGNLVDGATLSALWRTAQHDYFWISSDGRVYDYKLIIPGLSCSSDWDSEKYQYLCTPFVVESH